MKSLLLSFFLLSILPLSQAQSNKELKEVTSTYYIKNGMVVQSPGMVKANHSIIIRDGIIQEVGPNLTVPFDAQVVDADSMYVYPAFIDALGHAGLEKPKEGDRPRVKDPGNPPMDLAGITPQHTVRDQMEKVDGSLADLKKVGFGYAHVVPHGRMLPGKGSVISTGGTSFNNMVLKENTSQFFQFRSARGVFPATMIGVMSQIRDLLQNAKLSQNYEAAYFKKPAGKQRPVQSEELEALYPVVNKQIPMFVYAPKLKDVNRAIQLQKEQGFSLVLADVKQGWTYLSKIKNQNIPVVLSLDLPKKIEEEKEEEKKEEKGKDKEGEKEKDKKEEKDDEKKKKPKKKKKEDSPEVKHLKERKKAAYDNYLQQAAMFAKAGVPFSFSTLNTKPKDVPEALRRLVAAGLTEQQALQALTAEPAKLLGISNLAGTIEKGKIANIFITDKPYFEEKSKIKVSFIDGQLEEMKDEPKKENKEGSEDLVGTYSFSLEIPGDVQTGTIEVSKSGDEYKVSVESDQSDDGAEEAKNVVRDENNLKFELEVEGDGGSMTIQADMDFEEGAFEGTMSVGEFGTFPITGSKKPE